MTEDVAAAYDRRAAEYIELFGDVDATAAQDRDVIERWSDGIRGSILDAGCGPGQWTRHLAARRAEPVVGLDGACRFIAAARERFPGVSFTVGELSRLPFDDATLGGVLAWFSIIHTAPPHLPPVLEEFARVLRPGGSVLIGFFAGADRQPFDHAVTTAWFWEAGSLSRLLECAGFAVQSVSERHEEGMRPQGEIVATRV